MEHCVGSAGHAFGAHRPGRGAKQRQQLGRAAPDVLVRLPPGLPDRLPTRARLRDGLVGPRLVLAPDGHAGRFRPAIGQLDHPLVCSVWGSVTRTMPLLRLRSAVPVGHQVRVFWYELPAAASPRRLNRATNLATVVLLPKPACRAAAANPCPWTTANTAVARRTRSPRSLLLRASRSNAACSAGVTARTGSCCGVAILDLLRDSAVSSIAPDSTTYLRRDPLALSRLCLRAATSSG